MIFFLSSVGTVDHYTDFNTNNISLDCCATTATVYNVQYIIFDIHNNNTLLRIQLSYNTATTTIFYDRNDSSYYHPSTVLCPVYQRARIFLVIFFLSLVGAIGRDTDFRLLDQGIVGYLYHLQILLFNLQDSLSSKPASSPTTVLLSAITIMKALYESNNNPPSFDTNTNYDSSDSLDGVATTVGDTEVEASPRSHSMQRDINSSPSVHYDKNSSDIMMTTQVYSSSSSLPSKLSNKYVTFSDVANTVIRTTTSNDTVYNLYFDATFDTAFDNITFIASDDNGDNNGESHDPVYQFIIIDSATTACRTYTVAGGTPSAIMTTTALCSSYSMQRDINPYNTIYDLYFYTVVAIIVAVAPAVAPAVANAVTMSNILHSNILRL